jgi:hypothetical protein
MFFRKPFDYYIMRPPEKVRLVFLELISDLRKTGNQLGEVSKDGLTIESQISRTNWKDGEVSDEDPATVKLKYFYYNYLLEFYATNLKKRHKKDFDMNTIWYQIYDPNKKDFHDWHDHMPHASLCHVWYLKLPNGYGTEFRINDKIIRPKVKEGDLLVFPPNIFHRSPENTSKKEKIILSFNTVWA